MNNAYYKFLVVLLLMVLTVPLNMQAQQGSALSAPTQLSLNNNRSFSASQANSFVSALPYRPLLSISMPGHPGFATWRMAGDSNSEARQPGSVLKTVFNATAVQSPVVQMDKDLYTKNFGFFCRKELQVEKATKIPLRIRVGSLEQCNRLEEKN